jgi:hypothetical protein
VPIVPWAEWIALPPFEREAYWSRTRYLMLDRQDRVLYVGVYPTVRVFLSFTDPGSDEPELDDDNDVRIPSHENNHSELMKIIVPK